MYRSDKIKSDVQFILKKKNVRKENEQVKNFIFVLYILCMHLCSGIIYRECLKSLYRHFKGNRAYNKV